jgi:uncharacterized membrane protein
MINAIEQIFTSVVHYGVLLFEIIGVIILLTTAFRCVYRLFRRSANTRLILAQGIALALEFKIGGEVLRTVIVRDWNELIILGAIIALRGVLTFLIHWEIQTEEKKLGLHEKNGEDSKQ